MSWLKKFLQNRGVVVRKDDLVRLCESADKLGIEMDPDGLLECNTETVNQCEEEIASGISLS